jgi:hypothetical protein
MSVHQGRMESVEGLWELPVSDEDISHIVMLVWRRKRRARRH